MVSIIILSYNTKDLLRTCLRSIYKKITGVEFEVLVVDNASSDGTPQMVEKEFKKAVLIQNEKNVGFSKGNNKGAKAAKGTYVLFLNSDTEFLDGNIGEMVKFFLQNEKVAVVGGKMVGKNGTEELSAGTFFNLSQVFFLTLGLDKRMKTRFSPSSVTKVDFVSGGYMMVKKKIFQSLGGFDEHLFMYTEDMEFCYRVYKAGYTALFYPEASVIHQGHGSSSRSFAISHIYKGILYFYKKHKSFWEYALVKLLLVLKAGAAIGIGVITQNTYLKETYKSALKF